MAKLTNRIPQMVFPYFRLRFTVPQLGKKTYGFVFDALLIGFDKGISFMMIYLKHIMFVDVNSAAFYGLRSLGSDVKELNISTLNTFA